MIKRILLFFLLIMVCFTGCYDQNPDIPGAADDINLTVIDPKTSPYTFANGCYMVEFVFNKSFIAAESFAYTGGQSAEPFYLKPSSLGHYILYDRDGNCLSVIKGLYGYLPVRTKTLGENAIWKMAYHKDRDGFSLFSPVAGRYLGISDKDKLVLPKELSRRSILAFRKSESCAAFPEASLNVKLNVAPRDALARPNPGTPEKNYSDRENVIGYMDTHAHLNHFLGSGQNTFVGEAFDPLGITKALGDCTKLHGINGTGDLFGMVVDGLSGHDTTGYPDFNFWPTTYSQTHQQAYYKWLERSWLAGQRVLVQQMVSNEILCRIKKSLPGGVPSAPCDDMEIAELQINNIYAMQDYIDAQCGGPGQGWFRIVTSSREARKVVAQGKMAVFISLEFDTVYGASQDYFAQYRKGRITLEQLNAKLKSIEEQIDYFYDRGIRSVFPIHAFNNGYGGAQLYKTPIFNLVNWLQRGNFYDVEIASNPRVKYKEQGVATNDPDTLQTMYPFIPFVPVAGEGQGHSNAMGCTELGEWLIAKLMERKMIIEIDHMGDKTLGRVIDILWAARYPGVIASHTRILDLLSGQDAWEQVDIPGMIKILQLGGIVSPMLWQTLEGHQKCIADYLKLMMEGGGDLDNEVYEKYGDYKVHPSWYDTNDDSSDDLVWGVPYATDVNGACPLPNFIKYEEFQDEIQYGFGPLFDGVYRKGVEVSFDRQVTGNRVFDINGVSAMAHYGLMPDMIKKMQLAPETVYMKPLFNSAEAYLRMLERAEKYSETYPSRDIGDWE
jgi:hypothetical protein